MGEISEAATKTVDAKGEIVAPGFIDVHTHYDAQIFWDPTLSPSCYHGVTTILGGFCGFSLAPLTPKAGEYLLPMLARVEGMPLNALEASVPCDWSTFGEYLDRLEGNVGVNAGFSCGHSTIRRIVMGERAVGEKATPEDVEQMKALLAKSISEGALGFSTTISPTHNDADGNAVPSRWADYSEIIELGGVCRDYEGTILELLPDLQFEQEILDLMTDFSLAGQRAVNWNVLAVTGAKDTAERAKHQLSVSDYADARGAKVAALTVPCTPELYLNLVTGFVFDSLPGVWGEMFKLSISDRIEKYKDPAYRKQMADDAGGMDPKNPMQMLADLGNYVVIEAKSEKNKQYEGMFTRDIAKKLGVEPIDVMLDLAIDDELKTVFAPYLGGHDKASYELRAELWRDDRTLIGASDAGAHLDMIDTFAFSTILLQKGVREHKVITMEEAVHQISQVPAEFMGLIDRGLIEEGYFADVVIFDPNTVGLGPTYSRYDVPENNFRIYADAKGIDHVFVNGEQIISDGEHTGELPGTVFRSGRDTRTVPIPAMKNAV